jgi:formylmethanofuran dehydrogenase subunit C
MCFEHRKEEEMGTRSIDENLTRIRTRFNARSVVLIAISILLCTGIAGCEADPGAFVLSSPENGATSIWLAPTLTWTDADGETSYTVEIDDENTFSPPLVHQDTGIAAGTTSFVVPGGVLASGTTYYWRVAAINSAGSTTASNAPFSFTVLSSGALVPGFGADGFVTSDPSTGHDAALGIAIDPTAIYVVGCDYSPGNYQWRIEKRSLTDGSLISAFGTGGVVTSDPSTGSDLARGIAIDSTAMYVVGYDSSFGISQWRIEKRSLADGSLVPGFGTGGVVTGNHSTGPDVAFGIAIDSTAMYVIGYDFSPGNEQWRIEKRSLTDGSLISAFGTGGVVTSDPSTGSDLAFGIAIDSTAMYVVGYDSSPEEWDDCQWRIEKRSLADGSLVPGFGAGGVVTGNHSAGYDEAYSIAIDSTAMYVIGCDCSPGEWDYQWRIEKRSLADGSLVSGFGAGGVVTGNHRAGDDQASSMAIDSTAMYVIGCDCSPGGDCQWRIEKRSLTDGSLISAFGTGGVVTSDPSTGSNLARGIAIDSTAMYVVGRDNSPGDEQWRIEKRVK